MFYAHDITETFNNAWLNVIGPRNQGQPSHRRISSLCNIRINILQIILITPTQEVKVETMTL